MGLYRCMGPRRHTSSTGAPVTPDDGFADFFQREFAPSVRAAYVVLHDQQAAEDVAQEAFGQLYLNWSAVSGYDAPQAWVRRVTIRMAVRTARRDAARSALSRHVAAHPPQEARDLDLGAALLALPPQQRAVIALHYYQDLSAEDVGAALGCSASTVRTHLSRARTRLAQLMTDDEVDHAE